MSRSLFRLAACVLIEAMWVMKNVRTQIHTTRMIADRQFSLSVCLCYSECLGCCDQIILSYLHHEQNFCVFFSFFSSQCNGLRCTNFCMVMVMVIKVNFNWFVKCMSFSGIWMDHSLTWDATKISGCRIGILCRVSLCSCSLCLYRFNGNFRVTVILVCWTVLIYFLFHFLPLLSSLRLLTLALTVFSNQRFFVLNRGKKKF